jgi:hypothetical protein
MSETDAQLLFYGVAYIVGASGVSPDDEDEQSGPAIHGGNSILNWILGLVGI